LCPSVHSEAFNSIPQISFRWHPTSSCLHEYPTIYANPKPAVMTNARLLQYQLLFLDQFTVRTTKWNGLPTPHSIRKTNSSLMTNITIWWRL